MEPPGRTYVPAIDLSRACLSAYDIRGGLGGGDRATTTLPSPNQGSVVLALFKSYPAVV